MILILTILAISILVNKYWKFIRKQAIGLYILSTLICILFIVNKLNLINYKFNLGIFSRGTVSLALFTIVMFTGVINNPKIKSKFMSVRGELSIIACILTLGHNIIYGMRYFKLLIFNSEILSLCKFMATIVSLIMIILMIPLMITSFKCVRKKMKYTTWKRIQKTAYIFYGLMYVHIMLLYMPSFKIKYLDIFIYSLLFNLYFILRLYKYFKYKK
ncbi:ferric reductase-like transmembrane domain-containing protein [Clostridium botulinum]|uniref:Membrane protein n=3 Tax=Clostridium botulinum TaxID=1491 RepID=A0A0A0IJP4_CLOBO|nr:ferric reductase-like transmembrane domain-containing protein [Clostridium botulinum]KEI02533.1 membrane protein [Clostridium botulinum C/D str. BKT75002]KEI12344.1 membrane protein [Clostridium botulinum C/D str. BKT2873]KGN00804.1 membrane protein [Clostridium botulinum C/D str. DC5]KOC45701.1 hypothetical protein ADU88_13560 [Clostridium botulinum]KOC55391.1 hypothetical protein ADU89_05415 [Clostridium botulinum]